MAGDSNNAPAMMLALYTTGASAATPKRSCVWRMALTIEPVARKIGAMSIIRVSSTVSWVVGWSKPGTSKGTIEGAKMAKTVAKVMRAANIRLMTVDATRQARSCSPWAMRPDNTGISADAMAPAATSSNVRSGIRKAA